MKPNKGRGNPPPTKNFASADAQAPTNEEVAGDSSNKRKAEPSTNNNNHSQPNQSKNKRFNNQSGNRKDGTGYMKRQESNSLTAVPRLTYFPVFTSNIGCRFLAHLIYRVIRDKDYRIAQNISELMLTYVTILSYCNRVVQTAISTVTAVPQQASRLKQVTSGILLPDVLCKYIESIGKVETANGTTLVPWAAEYENMFPEGCRIMIDPAEILAEMGRPIPEGPWAIDVEVVIAYNAATSRGARSGIGFREVDNSTLVGREEMLVSYQDEQDEMLVPFSPQKMSSATIQLGACYQFRNYTEIRQWFGRNKQLLFNAFTTIPFEPGVVITNACVASFTGHKISTE